MEELSLTCRKCGHEEHGEAPYTSEIRYRMREHLWICHALKADDFDYFVRSHEEDPIAIYK